MGPLVQLEAPVRTPVAAPRIQSLLIKPASALCNLDCTYCFYLDRKADPYKEIEHRRMPEETLRRLVDSWMYYSYPNSTFAFQGGEPTLAGLPFFEKLVEFQQRYGRGGQNVSNALQTNGVLLDDRWAEFFHEYNWLIGLSMDGPEEVHDRFRVNKGGTGSWRQVMRGLETLQRGKAEFNILCVLSQSNVEQPREIYRFFRGLGIDNIQYIPLSEFDAEGRPLPETITPSQYGRFLVETFDLWWPERRTVRIRCFDNLAEGVAGMKPGACTMHKSCDSYVVVEYNGDIYPCDFFVEGGWRLGNLITDSWPEVARRAQRMEFASKKAVPHPACEQCQWRSLCHGGCPKFRVGRRGDFSDLDYFCSAYKQMFAHAVEPLRRDVELLLGRPCPPLS
ncbi:MAG: anaerobic sulfatase maturase [Bryobacterales bacterium]|nr:anaerobic sulfatase maturase [Bryobacterales bacterium]